MNTNQKKTAYDFFTKSLFLVFLLTLFTQIFLFNNAISKNSLSRIELGLPKTGFVFCCFNNNYKITISTFAGWMRILKAVNNSVLWLFENNSMSAKNLKKEALKHGINDDRLIFAAQMPVEEHLNRIKLADNKVTASEP